MERRSESKGEGEFGVKFNEPTTEEIAQALKLCYASDEIECYECPCRVSGGQNLCCMDKLADRLESQQREIERLMVACETINQEMQAMIDCHKPNLDKIAALTARAEQAEKERDAAKAYMKRFGCLTCTGQGTLALNDPCGNCRDKSKWEMRGLPQDGE